LSQSSDGPVKSFLMTGNTVTPAPFLGCPVFMRDVKNWARDFFINLPVTLTTACTTGHA